MENAAAQHSAAQKRGAAPPVASRPGRKLVQSMTETGRSEQHVCERGGTRAPTTQQTASPHRHRRRQHTRTRLTDQRLEEVALEDADDPLDGVPQLPVLRLAQLGAVLLQEAQGALGICGRTRDSLRRHRWATATATTPAPRTAPRGAPVPLSAAGTAPGPAVRGAHLAS